MGHNQGAALFRNLPSEVLLWQFFGSVKFDLRWLIWKPWAPTKCKFFAWLIIRNRVGLRTGLLREICHEMRYALCAEADRNQHIISSLLVATPSIFGA